MKIINKESKIGVVYPKWLVLIVLAFLVGVYFWWGIISTLMWFLFILFIIYDLDSRLMAVSAVSFLVLCLVLILFKKDNLAEIFSVYVYYFMIEVVVLQIIEFFRYPKLYDEPQHK